MKCVMLVDFQSQMSFFSSSVLRQGSIICTSSVLQKKDLSGCAKGLLTLLAAGDTCATLVATTDLTRHSRDIV